MYRSPVLFLATAEIRRNLWKFHEQNQYLGTASHFQEKNVFQKCFYDERLLCR